MTTDSISTRRSFLKVGALLAVPIAAPAALAKERIEARLSRREDEAAIRALHQGWLRTINRGSDGAGALLLSGSASAASAEKVRGVTADHTSEPEAIEFAADGTRAKGRFPCVVAIETELARDCTLAQMAHAQGCGYVRRTERGVLTAAYAKSGESWAIETIEFAAT